MVDVVGVVRTGVSLLGFEAFEEPLACVSAALAIPLCGLDFVTIASTENAGQGTFFTEKISEDKNKGN